MPTITIAFDIDLLPTGAATSINITANPAVATLRVKNDSVCFHDHPETTEPQVVTHVTCNLPANEALDVVFTPFNSSHPAVTEKPYSVRSLPLPHEDLLQYKQDNANLIAHVPAPTAKDKETTYRLSTASPTFVTIKVKRQ